MTNPLRDYQTEHLFLLIGGNPLPNLVAALLLARERGVIYLLHSHTTFPVAEPLKRVIEGERRDVEVRLREISETNGERIAEKISELLNEANGSVGLNYTSGTKPMVVHTHRALASRNPVYSYLDATTLQMVIEARQGAPTQFISVKDAVALKLKTLFALHGYSIDKYADKPHPRRARFCETLRALYADATARSEWVKYAQSFANRNLPTSRALDPIRQVMVDLCAPNPPTLPLVAQAMEVELANCKKFFEGGWLEEYTLQKLARAAQKFGITEYGIGLIPRRRDPKSGVIREMEIDVAALYGYQLFAISCKTTKKKEQAKEHFFEIFTHAGQLGGDEACFGLVSFYENSAGLRDELVEPWDPPGKIVVFSAFELEDLEPQLELWFEKAHSRERKT